MHAYHNVLLLGSLNLLISPLFAKLELVCRNKKEKAGRYYTSSKRKAAKA